MRYVTRLPPRTTSRAPRSAWATAATSFSITSCSLSAAGIARPHLPAMLLGVRVLRPDHRDECRTAGRDPRTLTLDEEALLACARTCDLVIVTSPNNPTGDLADLGLIQRVCHACHGLVMVDEAYIEFAGEERAPRPCLSSRTSTTSPSCARSKAYGAAGTRCGYVMAAADIIDALSAVRQIYSVNVLTQAAALRPRAPAQRPRAAHRLHRPSANGCNAPSRGFPASPYGPAARTSCWFAWPTPPPSATANANTKHSILVRDFSSAAGLAGTACASPWGRPRKTTPSSRR